MIEFYDDCYTLCGKRIYTKEERCNECNFVAMNWKGMRQRKMAINAMIAFKLGYIGSKTAQALGALSLFGSEVKQKNTP